MYRKILVRVAGLFGLVLIALGAAYAFRDDVVRLIAPRYLAGTGLELTRVQGLDFYTGHLSVADLEFLLDSGQQLVVKELAVEYRLPSSSENFRPQSISIGFVQLLPAATPVAAAGIAAAAQEQQESLLLSTVLQVLREFPIPAISLAELQVPQRSEPFALAVQGKSGELTLHLVSGTLQLDAGFAQAAPDATASLQVTLVNEGAQIGKVELSLQPGTEGYTLNGTGHLAIPDLNSLLDALEQSPLPLPLKTADLEWDLSGTVADGIGGTFDPTANTTQDFTLGISEGSLVVLTEGLAANPGELTFVFTDRAELDITTGASPAISTGVLPLRVNGSWQQRVLGIDTRLTLSSCELRTGAACSLGFDGSGSFSTYTLAGGIDVVMTDNSEGGPARYRISTRNLMAGGLPTWTPAFDIDATLALDGSSLSFATPLLLRGAPADARIHISGDYDLTAGTAAVQLTIPPVEFSEQGRALSAWLPGWPYPFDLLAGTLAVELSLQWQPDANGEGVLSGDISGSLNDLAGSHEEIFFRGVNMAFTGAIDTSAAFPLQTPPLSLTMENVDVGLPLENIALNFQIERDTQRLLISSASAEVLDGTISGTNIDYGFVRERNEVTLRFDGLRLERLLELAEYDGVAAVGAVSGEVPMAITANGVEVTGGTLHADAPGGSIRYLAGAAGVQSNVGLDLVNQALGNYQFDSLTSDIDYTPEGELLLAMKMQGRNPDMSNGQRINLNLNLSDNIPALLQSLQAARAIEDFLQQQYENPQ